MKITRKDIAKMAGVSTATVSYVINNSNRVGEETKRRVNQIIEEYNYRPDLVARAMSTRKTMQIAMLINDLFNNFFAEIVAEFERTAAEHGYSVSICTNDRNISTYVDNFVSRRMDGVFCMLSPTRIDMQKLYALQQDDIPVLVSGNPTADRGCVSLIEPDYMQGMELALQYLKGYGHRRIAYVSAFSADFESDIRFKAFRKYYDQLFTEDESQVVTGVYPFPSTVDSGFELTEQLLASGRPFTAIITTNDSMAIGCIEALQKHGLRVPEDVSVIGFDNITIGKHVSVPLTTVGFDKLRFANNAFQMLYRAMNEGKLSEMNESMYITERKSVSICPSPRPLPTDATESCLISSK